MKESTDSQARSKSDNGEQEHHRPKRKISGLLIMALLIIAFIVFNKRESVVSIDCTPEIMANKPDVIMLGAWWCPYCYQAKKYFQRNNIHYCEYDMESTITGKRLYEENGGGAIPILLINNYRLQGFSKQQIEAALATLDKTPE